MPTTQAPADAEVRTDVLVVGTGPAGAAMSLALATYGVDHVVITRYASLAPTSRRSPPCSTAPGAAGPSETTRDHPTDPMGSS